MTPPELELLADPHLGLIWSPRVLQKELITPPRIDAHTSSSFQLLLGGEQRLEWSLRLHKQLKGGLAGNRGCNADNP